jgi:hypothetical protein
MQNLDHYILWFFRKTQIFFCRKLAKRIDLDIDENNPNMELKKQVLFIA